MTRPEPSQPASTWGDRSRRRGLVGALADTGGVLATTGRLLAGHWPALLFVFVAGILVRELVTRVAVRASLLNAELGMLILLLAPMTTLTAMVLALRVVRPSLPWLGTSPLGSPPSVLTHLGSVLVPFMTIYYFEDDLFADIRDYNYRVTEDSIDRIFLNAAENIESGEPAAPPPDFADRIPWDLSVTLAAVVVGVIVARWLLGRWPAAQRHGWLGIPGAYLELVWLTLVMVLAFQAVSNLVGDWAGNRRVGRTLQGLWEQGVGNASGATSSPDAAAGWLLGQLGHVDAVLIIPLSWLAIGAVVIGHEPRLPTGPGPAGAGRQAYQRAQSWWLAAPSTVRWVGTTLTGDLRSRFTPLVQGAWLVARAGVVPMLLFCLAFVVTRSATDWLWQLERLVIGPQSRTAIWDPLSGLLGELNRAVTTMLLVCLLAAAIDRALHASHAGSAGDAADQPVADHAPTSNRA